MKPHKQYGTWNTGNPIRSGQRNLYRYRVQFVFNGVREHNAKEIELKRLARSGEESARLPMTAANRFFKHLRQGSLKGMAFDQIVCTVTRIKRIDKAQ